MDFSVNLHFLRLYLNAFFYTLGAESPSIFLDKSGRGSTLPDLSRKIEGDSARRVIFL